MNPKTIATAEAWLRALQSKNEYALFGTFHIDPLAKHSSALARAIGSEFGTGDIYRALQTTGRHFSFVEEEIPALAERLVAIMSGASKTIEYNAGRVESLLESCKEHKAKELALVEAEASLERAADLQQPKKFDDLLSSPTPSLNSPAADRLAVARATLDEEEHHIRVELRAATSALIDAILESPEYHRELAKLRGEIAKQLVPLCDGDLALAEQKAVEFPAYQNTVRAVSSALMASSAGLDCVVMSAEGALSVAKKLGSGEALFLK